MNHTMENWQTDVNKKLDRLLNDIDFIKNRVTTYLGRNEALTYLPDETPVFINTDDLGCPLNFMNGGKYEEEYFTVLLSYRKAGQIFLDIGANLGVYSIRLGQYMRNGKIHAFEPIPRIRELFARSSFLNGFDYFLTIHAMAVSDHDGEATLNVPAGHAGGASLDSLGATRAAGVAVQLRSIDSLMPSNFKCHLIKLDVEGHELQAMRGMKGALLRSPDCTLMFEKLSTNSGIESDVLVFASELAWKIYAIEGTRLRPVSLDEFRSLGGYFVAGRPDHIERDGLDRNFFDICPADLNVIKGERSESVVQLTSTGSDGEVLAHGPYWYIARGYYRVTFDATVSGAFQVDLAERFGYKVGDFEIREGSQTVEFPVHRDLIKFEFIIRSKQAQSSMSLRNIRITRLG
jgi:FkbM family methyltransferase